MEKTFVDMINANRGIIYKVCNLYCHENEYKQDLFQEIVLQVWKAFPSFRNESLRTTWMYRVALNTAISNFRKEIRKPERQSISQAEFQIPDISQFPDEHENLSLLKQAILQLTKIEKAIILLAAMIKAYLDLQNITICQNNLDVSLKKIIAVYERPQKFLWYTVIVFLFTQVLLFPLSFLPHSIELLGLWPALAERLIPISIAALILFIAYKLGAFKERNRDKFKEDLSELEELKSMSAELLS